VYEKDVAIREGRGDVHEAAAIVVEGAASTYRAHLLLALREDPELGASRLLSTRAPGLCQRLGGEAAKAHDHLAVPGRAATGVLDLQAQEIGVPKERLGLLEPIPLEESLELRPRGLRVASIQLLPFVWRPIDWWRGHCQAEPGREGEQAIEASSAMS
jgi:hypothetical protein